MGGLVVMIGFGLIYFLVPWLIARFFRDILKDCGIKHPIITLGLCGLAFWGVWQIRSDPTSVFHADQLGGYKNPADCHNHPDPEVACARALRGHYQAVLDAPERQKWAMKLGHWPNYKELPPVPLPDGSSPLTEEEPPQMPVGQVQMEARQAASH